MSTSYWGRSNWLTPSPKMLGFMPRIATTKKQYSLIILLRLSLLMLFINVRHFLSTHFCALHTWIYLIFSLYFSSSILFFTHANFRHILNHTHLIFLQLLSNLLCSVSLFRLTCGTILVSHFHNLPFVLKQLLGSLFSIYSLWFYHLHFLAWLNSWGKNLLITWVVSTVWFYACWEKWKNSILESALLKQPFASIYTYSLIALMGRGTVN